MTTSYLFCREEIKYIQFIIPLIYSYVSVMFLHSLHKFVASAITGRYEIGVQFSVCLSICQCLLQSYKRL